MTHVAAQDSVSTAGDVAVRLLREQLASDDPGASRAALAAASANINERFLAGESVVDLVHLRAAVVDELLVVVAFASVVVADSRALSSEELPHATVAMMSTEARTARINSR